jgi:hypothetical protein
LDVESAALELADLASALQSTSAAPSGYGGQPGHDETIEVRAGAGSAVRPVARLPGA